MSSAHLISATLDNDAALVQDVANGELSSLGTLYSRYADNVRRFALRTTGERAVAEDITHDTFIALIDTAKRYDPEYSLRSYLLGIAAKLMLRRRRRGAVTRQILSRISEGFKSSEEQSPFDAVSAGEQLGRYKQALSRLSTNKRMVVIMCDLEKLKAREVAAALDIPIGTVWTRLHHGRRELFSLLRWEGSR